MGKNIDKLILCMMVCLSGAVICTVINTWDVGIIPIAFVAWWTGYFAAKSIEK